jgi:cobyric acid synthase
LTPSFGSPKSPSVATYRKVKELPMSDVRTSHLGDSAEQRSCQAIILKGFKGHTVTLTIHKDTQVRVIVDKTVESYREAETIARAFAAQQGFPGIKVAVVSK